MGKISHMKKVAFTKATRILSSACLGLWLFSGTTGFAQSSVFTYQGRLSDTNGPANGSYDFEFHLFSSSSGGSALTSSIITNALGITNGLFIVPLDFGAAAFDGGERWLEIAVRSAGSGGLFAGLAPRQKITATPYAMRAASVPDGAITGAKIANGAVGTAQLAANAVMAGNITNGAIGAAQLAPGAAAANLQASAQSGVPSGGMILSTNSNDTNLLSAGYTKFGKVDTGGAWERRSGGGSLSARSYCTAIWTGTEMLVWGGSDGTNFFNDGGRYDPVANRWISISLAGAPAIRWSYSSIWTGSEMIIWGGWVWGAGGTTRVVNDGARYNPKTDTWFAIATNGAPIKRQNHKAIWTGTEMIIWGGDDGGSVYMGDGARYHPGLDRWFSVTNFGALSPRIGHSAIWTGNEMIIWGGAVNGTVLADGGRYTPGTDTWNAITSSGTPSARAGHDAIWTGTEMVIWGGATPRNCFPCTGGPMNDGGRYDPTANGWTLLSSNAAPRARTGETALWTGNEIIIWGGEDGASTGFFNDGGIIDTTMQGWNPLSPINAPAQRSGHAAVWTGSEMLIWGGKDASSYFNDLFAYTKPRSLFLYLRP